MKLASKRLVFLLVSCLVFNSPVDAQIQAGYHFGFIGFTGDTTARSAETVMIQYSKCFDINNGLLKFNTPKTGAFAISCVEIPPTIELQVYGYPNPVVNELSIRSLKLYPVRGLVKYRFVLTDFMGRPIKDILTDIVKINNGFTISVSDIPKGFFVVTLYADQEVIQSFKIFKGV